MWSRLLAIIVTAVFLMAVGVPVMSHDGRVLNTISDPIDSDDSDEHPWGGDNQVSGEPDVFDARFPDSQIDDGRYFLIRVAFNQFWLDIQHLVHNIFNDDISQTDSKRGAGATPMSSDESNTTTYSGTGTK